MRNNWIFIFRTFLVIACFFPCFGFAETILVFGGKTGWLGQEIVKIIQGSGHIAVCATSRLENCQSIEEEIERIKPDAILNCAGIIGKPNVDWCETHAIETLRVNVIGTIHLADAAYDYGLHVTNLSTGCIYEYDTEHPERGGVGFTEKEEPNFKGSFYSRSKIVMETLLLEYPNVLNLRIKMPVGSDLKNGFVAKIIKYKNVVNIANSLCVLDDLLPIAVDMTLKRVKGNYNFVNPGVISHHEVLNLYKEYIDPSHSWESISVEDQDKTLKARRANAELSPAKLLELYPDIPNIRDSLIKLFIKMRSR